MFLLTGLTLLLGLSRSEGSPDVTRMNDIDRQISDLEQFLKSPDHQQQSRNDIVSAWSNLGFLYQNKDLEYHNGGIKQPAALEAFNKALELCDDRPEVVIRVNQQKGILLRVMGRPAESLLAHDIAFNESVSNFDRSSTLQMKADSHLILNQVDAAIECYSRALDYTYYELKLYLPLVECYREKGIFTKDDWSKMLKKMEDSLALSKEENYMTDAAMKDAERSHLYKSDINHVYFRSAIYRALFAAADKAGQVDKAWKYLQTAQEMDIKAKTHAGSQSVEFIRKSGAQIREIFNTDFFGSYHGSESTIPVFIVGMMRSGSTLLETMLDAHPNVWGMGEDSVFNGNLPKLRDEMVAASEIGGQSSVDEVIQGNAEYTIRKMKDRARSHFSKNPELYGNRTIKSVKKITDKMLFNYKNLGFIHITFPRSPVLHTMRDPMDTLFSCFKHKFDDLGLDWSLDIKKLVSQYVSYLEIMHHFRIVLPGRVLDIRYEAVVADNEKVMRKVLKRVGLPWDSSILDFYKSNRTVQTNSMSQVRHQISSGAIGSWRKYSKHLKPLAKEFLKYVPDLRSRGVLVYPKSINWDCDPQWDYEKAVDADEEDEGDEEIVAFEDRRGSREAVMSLLGGGSDNAEEVEIEEVIEADSGEGEEEEEEETEEEAEMRMKRARRRRRRRIRGKRRGGGRKRSRGVVDDVESDDDTVQDPTKDRRARTKKAPSAESRAASTVDKVRTAQTQSGKRTVEGRLEDRLAVLMKKYSDPSARNIGKDKGKEGERSGVNPYIEALKGKGLPPSSLGMAVSGITSQWEHRSIHPSVDYILGLGHIYVHYQEMALGATAFKDILDIYREEGLLLPCSDRECGNSHPWSLDRVPKDGILAPVGRCFIGYGSATALKGKHALALEIFEEMMVWQKDNIDGITKHAEVASSLGNTLKSLSSYERVVQLGEDSVSVRIGMGSIHFNDGNHRKALQNFQIAWEIFATEKVTEDTAEYDEAYILHRLGKCYKEMNDSDKAKEIFEQALSFKPRSKEIMMDLAAVLMAHGNWSESLPYIQASIDIDPNYRYAFGYRGLLKHGLGWPRQALTDLKAARETDQHTDPVVGSLSGVCYSCLGDHESAVKEFSKVLSSGPNDTWHHVWYRRELAYYYMYREKDSFRTYNYDEDMSNRTKHGMSQHETFVVPPENEYKSYRKYIEEKKAKENAKNDKENEQNEQNDENENSDKSKDNTKDVEQLKKIEFFVKATSSVARLIQLDHPGFIPNQRQYRQFGLSVLQITQSLQEHISLLYEKKGGLPVIDASSSGVPYRGMRRFPVEEGGGEGGGGESDREGYHVFGWRDLFDIAVRWRQSSEPMDVVYWLDRMNLSEVDFKKVGLNTYMVSCSNNIIRYSSYNEWAINITKTNLETYGYMNQMDEFRVLPDHIKKRIKSYNTHEQLFSAVGGGFYQILPIHSILSPGTILDGTRLTLRPAPLAGFDFSIISASTSKRTVTYQLELSEAFMRIERTMLQLYTLEREGGSDSEIKEAKKRVLQNALKIFYYWVNFAPITRGTSATGYAALLGVILTMGEEPADPIPYMTQYDWVAMFTPHPEDFVTTGLLWLKNLRPTSINTELLNPHVPLSANYRDLKCNSDIESSVLQEDVDVEMEMDTDGSPKLKSDINQSCKADTSPECTERKSFLKLRVGDVFDSMADIVTALNCLGERRYDDPLLVV